MRSAVFASTVLLLAAVLLAQGSFRSQNISGLQSSQQAQRPSDFPNSDGVRMWRRAQIRVVPLDIAVANSVKLESLRNRVAQAERDALRLNPRDPITRKQLDKQLQLMQELLSYADSQDSDAGKSRAALEVQRHLNQIEGKLYCQACHTEVIAGTR
jgi:hypothetical protein